MSGRKDDEEYSAEDEGQTMRDPLESSNDFEHARTIHGIAFEISDLFMIQGWCDFHKVPFVLRLDHGFQREDYEEVIEFPTEAGSMAGLIMWRQPDGTIVLPEAGARRRHATVAEALHGLTTQPNTVLTDITATTWPAH